MKPITELTADIRAALKKQYPDAGIKARTQRNARYSTVVITHERGSMTEAEREEVKQAAQALISNYENPREGTPYVQVWSR